MFHRHDWEVRSVKEYEYVRGGGDVTVVLSKCTKCPKFKTDSIPGIWTEEELGLG